MVTYFVDELKQTIVARLEIEETGAVFIGKTKLRSPDKWDQEKGEKIARLKALRKFYKSEFAEALAQYQRMSTLRTNAKAFATAKAKRLKSVEKELAKFI